MAEEVHENDVGTSFIATFKDGTSVVDISGANTKNLIFMKPDKSTASNAGTFTSDGTDGKLYWDSTTGFLTPIGDWQWQGHVAWAGGDSWRSSMANFRVYPNIG